jgi:hypothetical protein
MYTDKVADWKFLAGVSLEHFWLAVGAHQGLQIPNGYNPNISSIMSIRHIYLFPSFLR